MREPLFILFTESSLDWASIRMAGELCTDSPCIEYYHFPNSPYPDRTDYHFMRFMLEDGTTVRTPFLPPPYSAVNKGEHDGRHVILTLH